MKTTALLREEVVTNWCPCWTTAQGEQRSGGSQTSQLWEGLQGVQIPNTGLSHSPSRPLGPLGHRRDRSEPRGARPHF